MQNNKWFIYIPSQYNNGILQQPPPHNTPIALNKLVENAIARYVIEARQKSIHLGLEKSLSPAMIWGDESQIVEIIDVLIRNALNQTLEGYIKINLFEDSGYFGLTISDSGLGIDPDQNIFYTNKNFKGRPCRIMHIVDPKSKLSSIKNIIKANNGALELQIVAGIGTARRLWLPAISPIDKSRIPNTQKMSEL